MQANTTTTTNHSMPLIVFIMVMELIWLFHSSGVRREFGLVLMILQQLVWWWNHLQSSSNIYKHKSRNAVVSKSDHDEGKNDVSKFNLQASNNNISNPVVAAVTLDIACKLNFALIKSCNFGNTCSQNMRLQAFIYFSFASDNQMVPNPALL